MRLSGTDWVDGGWDIAETCAFPRMLEGRGCAAIHVSSGGAGSAPGHSRRPLLSGPARPRREAGCHHPAVAVSLISDFEQAEAIVGTGDANLVALARTVLYDPHWPWHAAAHLGARVRAPNQYLRSQPRQYRALFDVEGSAEG